MNTCFSCGEETTNPKFCSRSCSAKYTNKAYPKRSKKIKECNKCGAEHTRRQSKYCSPKCSNQVKYSTIQECIDYYAKHGRAAAYNPIRSRARTILKKIGITCCQKCGYDKHWEACHIKAIKDFDPETPIEEVNSKENLMALCPNCHWEFDNNFWVSLR